MATAPVLWVDSFGSQDLSHYTAGASVEVGTGRGGRNVMLYSTSPFSGRFQFPLVTSATRFIIGAAVKASNVGFLGIGGVLLQAGQTALTFNMNPDFDLNTVSGTIMALTASTGWTHIVLAVTRHASAGTVDVWVNSNLVLSLTGLNTTASGYAPGFGASNGTVRFCDLILQTSTTNTDLPLGDLAVTEEVPTADGAHTDMTPSTGTSHYALVDEAPPNDADYVAGTAVGQRDTFVMGDLPAATVAVKAVVLKYRAAKTDAGTGAVGPTLRIVGTDYDGTGQNLSTNFTQYSQVYEVSPATGVAFTVAEVNGLEAGVKRTA